MNIQQAFKMAWRSIWGKKGRSALTILGIFIGIAAVMTIVSVMEGMKQKTMEQFDAMGSNRITVEIYSWMYDEEGNDISKDYFPDLYDYCTGLSEYVVGVTPTGWVNATVSYGTKSTANFEYSWDEKGNITGDLPPDLYYGSDQYSVCNNLTIAKGRDLALLDVEKYNQVCVMAPRRRTLSSARLTRWARSCRSTATPSPWWASTLPASVRTAPAATLTTSSYFPTPPAGCWEAKNPQRFW